MNKQYYEADVIAEHLARRYPQGGLSGKVTEIGMQSLADAYNTYTEIDRRERYSASDRSGQLHRGDLARSGRRRQRPHESRLDLQRHGSIRQGDRGAGRRSGPRGTMGRGPNANRGGALGQEPRPGTAGKHGGGSDRSPEVARVLERLFESPPRRRSRSSTDPGLIGNVGDLAIVLTETGKPKDALGLLLPIVKAQTVKSGPGYGRLMEAQLKAYITSGQVEPAIASMKALEQAGGAASRAQLYYKLGKLLEKELDSLKQKRNTAALSRMHQAYKTFLTTLAESKTGQTYDSLQWAGEGLLTLDANQEAEKVFRRVLDEFTKDPEFLQQPNGRAKLLRTRLKLAAALRGQGKSTSGSSTRPTHWSRS